MAASPTSRSFSASPRFPASSTVRSSQSPISSSHLNHEVDPSKSGEIFTVIPLEAVHWFVDSARYAPTNDSADRVVFTNCGYQWNLSQSLISLVESFDNFFNGIAFATMITYNLLHCHVVDVKVFFLCNSFVTRKRGNTQPRTHTSKCMILFSPGSIQTNPLSMMNEYKDSPKDVQLSLGAHWRNHSTCTTVWP